MRLVEADVEGLIMNELIFSSRQNTAFTMVLRPKIWCFFLYSNCNPKKMQKSLNATEDRGNWTSFCFDSYLNLLYLAVPVLHILPVRQRRAKAFVEDHSLALAEAISCGAVGWEMCHGMVNPLKYIYIYT